MNSQPDCEAARLQVMAAFDREARSLPSTGSDHARAHLQSCADCTRWLADLQALDARFDGLSYAAIEQDLWPAIAPRLRPAPADALAPRLAWIAAVVLAWRGVQLLVDLPHPVIQSIVFVSVVVMAVWQVMRDPLAIATFAPELQKRGA